MPSMPALPQYTTPPNPYTPEQFGTSFNPWGGTTDPTSGSSDPYAQSIASAEDQAIGAANSYNLQSTSMQNNIAGSQQAMSAYNSSTAAYPSYPNIAGAGSQTAGQSGSGVAGVAGVPQQMAPQMNGSGQLGAGAQQATADTSNGFNPWSLTGEAMTRSN